MINAKNYNIDGEYVGYLLPELPVRFFCYTNENTNTGESLDMVDIVEISENNFTARLRETPDVPVIYERHTVRENGVSQICITLKCYSDGELV